MAPTPEPKEKDQVNLTDEESRIMPISGGGFEQCYNAQASVDTETMLVLATHVSQAPNDKQEIVPALKTITELPEQWGVAEHLLGDTGFFSAANVAACEKAGISALLASQRDPHHMSPFTRFAPDAPTPATDDPVERMKHRLTTKAGRALYGLRKQTVEPVFGIIKHVMGFRQLSMRGVEKAAGEWTLVSLAWHMQRMNSLRTV